MKRAFIIGAILALLVAFAIHAYEGEEEVYQAVVTAEVKLDCTVETHMYTEECIKRFTDSIAEARAFKAQTRSLLEKAIENDNEADALLDSALENYNTVYGG